MKVAGEMLLALAESRVGLLVWRSRLFFYAATVAFVTFGSISGDSLFVAGNLHDTFIWLNSGYFVEKALRPHIDFSTALGPAYIYLNYFARTVLERQSDMPLLTGAVVFLALTTLLLALRKLLQKGFLPDTLFIVFILLLSGRLFGEKASAIHWYGSYNRMGWACLLVFAVLLISREEALLRPTERQKTAVAAAGGLLFAFLLMLKISFFVALGILYLGWAVASCKPRDLRVVWIPAAIVSTIAVAVHFLVGDISFYLADILAAARARTGSAGIDITKNEVGVAAAFVLVNCVIDRWAYPDRSFDMRRFGLWVAMALALTFATLGDFSKPLIFLGIILSARVFYRHAELFSMLRHPVTLPTLVVCFLPFFAVSFIFVESSSVIAMARWKLGDYKEGKFQQVVWQLPGDRGMKINFLISNDEAQPDFSTLAGIIDASPEREDLFEEISRIEGGLFHYTNSTYVAMVDEAADVIRKHGASDRRAFALEFTNPLPLLLGGPPPTGGPLWLHEGTTFAESDVTLLDRAFADAEIVAVPHATIDADMRPLLNGMFASYNATNARFCKFQVGEYWTFYELCP